MILNLDVSEKYAFFLVTFLLSSFFNLPSFPFFNKQETYPCLQSPQLHLALFLPQWDCDPCHVLDSPSLIRPRTLLLIHFQTTCNRRSKLLQKMKETRARHVKRYKPNTKLVYDGANIHQAKLMIHVISIPSSNSEPILFTCKILQNRLPAEVIITKCDTGL